MDKEKIYKNALRFGIISEKEIEFPDSRQSTNFSCGAAAAQSLLLFYGIEKNEDELMKELKTTEEHGTEIEFIKKVLKKNKIKFDEKTGATIEDIEKAIDAGKPALMTIQAWRKPKKGYTNSWSANHYVIAVGYDSKNIYFDDPYVHTKRGVIAKSELDDRWHSNDISGKLKHYLLVTKGKKKFDSSKPEKIV